MFEIWKDIPEWEGFYQASNKGRIRSLTRDIQLSNGRTRHEIGRILKQTPDSDGYLVVSLRKAGKGGVYKVHRLVLLTFKGPPPKSGMVARHFPDRNRTNNRLSNLWWASQKRNQLDRKIHGTDNCNERNGRTKLSDEQVKSMRADHKKAKGAYGTIVALSRQYKVHVTTVLRIVQYQSRV